MSSVQTRSGASSAGTKVINLMDEPNRILPFDSLKLIAQVNAGKNAPVTRESAGDVQNDSLAAESYRAGGEFAKNRNAEPGDVSSRAIPRSQADDSTAESAPSYVSSQHVSDKGGPHGKNLKKGGFDDQDVQDGVQKAFESEPGSINDPGRLAEAKFEQREAANPRVATNRDVDLKTGTAYDGLDPDVDA